MFEALSVFFGEDPDLLDTIKSAASVRTFKSGTRIVGEGEPGDTIFCILEGEARAIRYSENGNEVWLDRFQYGALIGEMAVLGNGVRTADLYAIKPLTILVIPGSAFLSLMEKHGSIGIRMSRMLVERMLNTTHRVFEQATLSSKGMVCAELLRLAKPVEGEERTRIQNPPTISDIAKKLSIARETTSRTLSELKDEGILEMAGRDIVILHPDILLDRLHQ